jgi:HSP20 family protein
MTNNVFDEFEELLDRMGDQLEEGLPRERPDEVRVDVLDEGDRYVLEADLPGFDSEEIDLTLSGRRLTIAGERPVADTDGRDYLRRERPRGSVRRTVKLPEAVVEEEVSAGLEEGVLTVHLPKVHDQEGKTIDIDEG